MKLELRPRTDLTLRTVAALTDERRWRAAELAEVVGTTPGYLAHVMGPLTRAGWVRSVPGPTGGHELVADLGAVSVLDLIEAVEGPTDDGRCVMAARPCPAPEPCALHESWVRARSAMTAELAATPLRTVMPNQPAAVTSDAVTSAPFTSEYAEPAPVEPAPSKKGVSP